MTDTQAPDYLSGIVKATWQELVDGVLSCKKEPELREAMGRAEGYARGVFEAGLVSVEQRNDMVVRASRACLKKVDEIRAASAGVVTPQSTLAGLTASPRPSGAAE